MRFFLCLTRSKISSLFFCSGSRKSKPGPEISWCRKQNCGKVSSSMNAMVRRLFHLSAGFSAGLLFVILMLISLSCAGDERSEWREKMQSILPRGYLCHFATNGIKVDGNLDDAAWALAPWTSDFGDIVGPSKPAPRFRTRAKMLWDDNYLYVASELEEPHVWATLTNHDSVIFRDPDFEVFIDPKGSTHNYYEFEMNALNTGWDLRLDKPYLDHGKPHNEWDIPGLKTAVLVRGTLNDPSDTDLGWSVEIAFPWQVLGQYARHPGRRMKANNGASISHELNGRFPSPTASIKKNRACLKIIGSGHRRESSTCTGRKCGACFSSRARMVGPIPLHPFRARRRAMRCWTFIMRSEIFGTTILVGRRV